MDRIIDAYKGDLLGPDGKLVKELAQGYVSILVFDAVTRQKIKRYVGRNTVVNDARRAVAAQFANLPGSIGLGLRVDKYRMGYQNVLADHWDVTNNKPLEVPFTENTPLTEYSGTETVDYWHTQASTSGLLADGKHFVGTGNPLAQLAIPLGVDYPFNGDEYAVRLSLELDGATSTGATFDTVEVIMANGAKFAHRWTYPITKQPSWGLAIEHLLLF